MTEKRYMLVFSGKLVEGRKPPEVLSKLSDVLGLGQQEVRELFKTGCGTIILNDLDTSNVYVMQEKLREAGAICSVREIPAQQPLDPLSGTMLTVESTIPSRPAKPKSAEPQSRMQAPPLPQKEKTGKPSLIIKLILLLCIVAGCWWGYQTYLAS